jgi:hypothetical protein
VAEATIHAPVASIDLTEWVFTLTNSECQACSRNHIAAAATLTPEGKTHVHQCRVGRSAVAHLFVANSRNHRRCIPSRTITLSSACLGGGKRSQLRGFDCQIRHSLAPRLLAQVNVGWIAARLRHWRGQPQTVALVGAVLRCRWLVDMSTRTHTRSWPGHWRLGKTRVQARLKCSPTR